LYYRRSYYRITTLYPRAFTYIRAESTEHAISLLEQYQGEASVLAGGMSLVPLMKYRLKAPAVLIDIGRLKELSGISLVDGELCIKATTRHTDACVWSGDPRLALVPELASRVGDPQVRNMGTVGGGLAAAEPTGDWLAALLAMRGAVNARSGFGERRILSDEFVPFPHRSALRAEELLTSVALPLPTGRFATAYAKSEARRAAAPLMSCAVCVSFDHDGTAVTYAGVGCVGIEARPVRLASVENVLCSETFSPQLVDRAAKTACECSDWGFGRSVCQDLVRRALLQAVERAGVKEPGQGRG
jgi:aerobic carbon-monoxide dehydrogenase medium subunit